MRLLESLFAAEWGDIGGSLLMYGFFGGMIVFFIWFHFYQQKKRDRLRREQKLREERWERKWEQEQAVQCPICNDLVTGEHFDCPVCQARHHPECWKLSDGCGKCGLSTNPPK